HRHAAKMSFAGMRAASRDCSNNFSARDSNQHVHRLHARAEGSIVENRISVSSRSVLLSIWFEGFCQALEDALFVPFSRRPYFNCDLRMSPWFAHPIRGYLNRHYRMSCGVPESQEKSNALSLLAEVSATLCPCRSREVNESARSLMSSSTTTR